jgi:hypothetical protein
LASQLFPVQLYTWVRRSCENWAPPKAQKCFSDEKTMLYSFQRVQQGGVAGHRARCDSHHWDQTVYGVREYLAQEADCCP